MRQMLCRKEERLIACRISRHILRKYWCTAHDQNMFRKKETEKTKEGLALLREHYKELQTAYPEAFSKPKRF